MQKNPLASSVDRCCWRLRQAAAIPEAVGLPTTRLRTFAKNGCKSAKTRMRCVCGMGGRVACFKMQFIHHATYLEFWKSSGEANLACKLDVDVGLTCTAHAKHSTQRIHAIRGCALQIGAVGVRGCEIYQLFRCNLPQGFCPGAFFLVFSTQSWRDLRVGAHNTHGQSERGGEGGEIMATGRVARQKETKKLKLWG